MASRRADGGTFAFDLEPDDETVEELPVEPSRLGRAAGALGARVRSWPRRRVVAVAAVVGVAVAGTVGTVSLTAMARQRAWAQVAATVPGAVLDLGHEPVEAWRVPVATPTPLGLVGDVLVVQSSEWDDASGPMVYGVDLDKDEVAWTATPGDEMSCTVGTPNPYAFTASPRVPRGDVVTCLAQDQRRVTVIDADGVTVADRALADTSPAPTQDDLLGTSFDWAAHRVHPTLDGGLVRFDRVGPRLDPPAVEQDDPAGPTESDGSVEVYGSRSVTLLEPVALPSYRARLEDAATGEVRWETVLEADDLPAGSRLDDTSGCLVTDAGGDLALVSGGSGMDVLDGSTVWTAMCGIDALLDITSGEVLQRRDPFDDAYVTGNPPSMMLDDGLYAELERTDGTSPVGISVTMHVTRDGGVVVGDVPGFGVPPLATDGPGSALIVTEDPDGDGMAAYDADDAHLLWRTTAVQLGRAVTRTAEVVVLTDGSTLVGVDRETGRTLWTHELYEAPGDGGLGWYAIVDAVTDGTRLAVTVPARQGEYADPVTGEKRMIALDLSSGEVLWATEGSTGLVQPIGGRLYRFDTDAVVALE